jgi:hypothetical protein
MVLTPTSPQCRTSSGCEEMASRYGGLAVSILKNHSQTEHEWSSSLGGWPREQPLTLKKITEAGMGGTCMYLKG